jgi:hypothetical protein
MPITNRTAIQLDGIPVPERVPVNGEVIFAVCLRCNRIENGPFPLTDAFFPSDRAAG